jgi:hypothetical protein
MVNQNPFFWSRDMLVAGFDFELRIEFVATHGPLYYDDWAECVLGRCLWR